MKLKFIVALLFLASGVAYLAWKQGQGPQQEAKQEQEGEQEVQQKEQEQGIEQEKVLQKDIEVIAENLNIPWEIAFLPGGDLLVIERKGTLVRIGKDRKVYQVSGVKHRGEGGLLGMALHPNFAQNKRIYLYLTTETGQGLENRVERYVLNSDALSERKVILGGIPGSSVHDGGRMEFGPDGFLYITTGDAGNSNFAQDKNSLAGKILRLKDDGSIPSGNPFGTPIYSYGHRNPQGLAWDNQGRLWSTEHGRSGVLSGLDELNLVEKGENYGWPVIQGDEKKQGMKTPILHSGASTTWAPGDAEYVKGSIFFGGLRGQALYQAVLGETIKFKAHFQGEFGRVRAVRKGSDGMLYIATSNHDSRGEPRQGDDKIIRINPGIF